MGSCSLRQGMLCHSGTVWVVTVHSSSCKMWVYSAYSAHCGLRPGACYPGGSIVVLAFEQNGRPLLTVSPPSRGGAIPNHTWSGQESFGPAGS